MPVRFRKNCKICIAVKHDQKLLKRIYNSHFYMGKGYESLLNLSRETGLRYDSLVSHCKKHQTIEAEALLVQQANAVAKQQEKKIAMKMVRTTDARQDAMNRLMTELQKRDLSELTGRDVVALLLKATKDSDEVRAKAKDQDIDVFKLMSNVRSGEVEPAEVYEEFDPWAEAIEGELVEEEFAD